MKMEDLEKKAKKYEISLNKFYVETGIPTKMQTQFKKENFVPSAIILMFNEYIKSLKIDETEKIAFFKKAKKAGLEIKNGFVELSVFKKNNTELEINEKESCFVKFVF